MRVGLRPVLIRMVWPATIPGTVVYEFEADYGVCVSAPELFARVLLDASRSVQAAAAGGIACSHAHGIRPVATYPLPSAISCTCRWLIRRSRWLQGRSNPSKLWTNGA